MVVNVLDRTAARVPAGLEEPWDWRVPARRGDTDPPTAQSARRRRTAWRIAHPEAWQAYLRGLPHYDSAYVYDEGHEYDFDWTTDPDYSGVGKRCEYDAEGFVSPDLASHDLVIYRVLAALLSLFGRDVHNLSDTRVQKEPDLHFEVALGRDLGLLTDGGNVKEMVAPDVVVAPEGEAFPEHREIVLRGDDPDPVPAMVVEVRSPSTGGWDLNGKMRLYAALGVQEYLLVETGERTGEPGLDLYCLRDGQYHRVPGSFHVESNRSTVSVFSEVCGTHLRLQETGNAPLFQWFDVDEGCWRDPESDFGVEREAHGEAKGRLEQTLLILNGLLPDQADLEQVAEHWTATGLPDNAAELVLQVMAHPRRWREILSLPSDKLEGASDPDDFAPT